MYIFLLSVITVVQFAHWSSGSSADDARLNKDYCIIGAGPGGLQLGHFLQRAGRDYVIFERNEVPGSFFTIFPRHRKLISINKRYTGKLNKEFNLRHDWNSLISDDETLLFTKYSNVYFPPADLMVDYLRDYQQKLAINVQFSTDIRQVQQQLGKLNCRYSLLDQTNSSYCCKTLIIATGLWLPNIPESMNGTEYMEGYESIPIDPAAYEGQSVLIIGHGNSGMETAMAIYGAANFVHLIARSRIRLSWETHYVGDLRGVNNEVLDAYMLKSLDGFFEISDTRKVSIVRQSDGKLGLRADFYNINEQDNNPAREGYDRVIRCMGFRWDNTIFHNNTKPRCATKNMAPHLKYPDIKPNYESSDFEHMFFVGTLTHSLDFRKSAGGFIHGFRYTAKVLHNLMEWRYHSKRWPATERLDIEHLLPTLLKRANEGSGIYQMFSDLGDLFIFNTETLLFTHLEEFPLKLIPKLTAMSGHSVDPQRDVLFVLDMEYGANFSQPGKDHFGQDRAQGDARHSHESNFLHPVIYFYRKLPTEEAFLTKPMKQIMPTPDGIHHVLEDFTTQFDGPSVHLLPLRRFFEHFLGQDLRTFLASSCIQFALTFQHDSSTDLPVGCRRYLSAELSSVAFM